MLRPRIPLLGFLNSNISASSRNSPIPSLSASLNRTLTNSSHLSEKALPPRLKLDDADLTLSYLKGTGPGGQKINKTNSAVQITHKPTGIVIKCQETRSRSQNEKYARQILADRVEQALNGDKSRVAIKAARDRKKKASKMKKSRRKYRELDGERGAEGGVESEGLEEVEGKGSDAEKGSGP